MKMTNQHNNPEEYFIVIYRASLGNCILESLSGNWIILRGNRHHATIKSEVIENATRGPDRIGTSSAISSTDFRSFIRLTMLPQLKDTDLYQFNGLILKFLYHSLEKRR
jgi:hypothetical protein